MSLGQSGGIGKDVRQSVIDRRQARCAGVTQVGELDRSGFAGQEKQAVLRGVAREIDQENCSPVVQDGAFFAGAIGDIGAPGSFFANHLFSSKS